MSETEHDHNKTEGKTKVKPTLYFFPDELEALSRFSKSIEPGVKKSMASTIEFIVREYLEIVKGKEKVGK